MHIKNLLATFTIKNQAYKVEIDGMPHCLLEYEPFHFQKKICRA